MHKGWAGRNDWASAVLLKYEVFMIGLVVRGYCRVLP